MLQSVRGTLACSIVVLVLFAGVAAPWIAPHDPIVQNLSCRLQAPSRSYPLGTDEVGRCILSRILYGARISATVGLGIVGISASIGIILGILAGYAGGLIDGVIMRTVDVLLAFPGLILAIVLAGVMGPGLKGTMLALTLVHWTSYARLTRSEVLRAREEPWVDAARALGANPGRIVGIHILPNILSPIVVMASFGLGHMILAAAAMSFLGLGVQPPDPEWGAMLNRGRDFMRSAPQLMLWPGLAITITVLGFNLFGDALHDAFHAREEDIARQ
jgi:peptide/nickel transport system permease protein